MYNRLIENLLLPMGDFFFKSQYISSLKFLRNLVKKDEKYLENYQKDKLKEILTHATKNAAYYSSKKIDWDSDPSIWIKNFPILDKLKLKNNMLDLLTEDKSKLIKYSSSGSSGIHSEVYVNKEEQSLFRATQTLWWEWAGFRLGSPILQTGLASVRTFEKSLKDFLLRTYYLFAFSISHAQAKAAFEWSKPKKPFLGGYASSLYVLATLAREQGVKVKFKSAITWGDKLFAHYKTEIEEVFECKVYETYGANEGLMLASQKDLEYMYIMSPCVYIEILNDQGEEVQDGEMGHVVVTSLIAKSMPLIRYKLGDLAIKLPKSKYPADRDLKLPILEKVVGRETDLVLTPNGHKMIVHSFTGIFNKYPSILQFCVIQSELEKIEIQYIPTEEFQKDHLIQIEIKILEFLNDDLKIDFKEVDFIPATKSGKPQIIISELIKGKQAFSN